jgi:hypothetical protein
MDTLQLGQWEQGEVNVILNDTDDDGDYPLSIVSISGGGYQAYQASSTEIGWTGSPVGTYYVTYTVQDSRGATSTGTLVIEVIGGTCGENFC